MANGTPEKIQVTQYKISGFNVVVTMPDGQQQVLKDGLADLMLGNIILTDKNGAPISTDQILSNINLKQNALDSAFLGDFIRSKDENDNGADKTKIQQNTTQSELEQTIDQLRAQIKSLQSANPQSDELARLASENQANQQKINNYIQQLQQAKAEVVALKESSEEKESIKQQLPHQNLAETFQANQQQPSTPDSTTTTTPASSPINTASSSSGQDAKPTAPPTPLQPSSSSSSSAPPVTPGIILADNQTVVDRDLLEKLKQAEEQAKTQAEQAQSQADRAQAAADKAQAEADKAQENKQKLDEALADLAKAHFISPDLNISAKLDPKSDHGNDSPGSKTDNITNDTTPTLIGTATKGNREAKTENSVKLIIYHLDDNASADTSDGETSAGAAATDPAAAAAASGRQVIIETIAIPTEDKTAESKPAEWKYDISESLTDGKYRYIVTTESKIGDKIESSRPWVGDFTIDTKLPNATISTISNAVQPNKEAQPGDWITTSKIPVFTGKTKPDSEVKLTLTEHDHPGEKHDYNVTAGSDGTWLISVNNDPDAPAADQLGGTHYDYKIDITDTAGNTNASGSGTGSLTIDTSDLKVTLGLAKDSDSGDSHTDWATNVRTPTFTGKATKGESEQPVGKVHIKITVDGKVYEGDSKDDGTWSITPDTPIANGTKIVLLQAEDPLGKQAADSHFIVIDDRTPAISASLTTETDSGSSHTDGITQSTAPVLHGTTTAIPPIIAAYTESNATAGGTRPESSSITPESSSPASAEDATAPVEASGSTEASGTATASPGAPAASPDATGTTLSVSSAELPKTPAGAHITFTVYYNPTGKGYFDTTTGQSKVDDSSFSKEYKFNADANGNWNFAVPVSEFLDSLKADTRYNSDRANQFLAHPDHPTDGIWQYKVDITDTLGNHAATELTNLSKWTIDTTAPGITDKNITGSPAEHTDYDDKEIQKDPYAVQVPQPTYTINTEPGNTVAISYQAADNSITSTQAIADDKGVATIKFPKELPQFALSGGSATKVQITVTDLAGNSAQKDIHMKYIPSKEFRIPLDAHLTHTDYYDTGSSHNDSITNNNRPEISGTTAPGALVTLKINGRTFDTHADATSGHWAIRLAEKGLTLSDGYNEFEATATSGIAKGVAKGGLTVDTTRPILDTNTLQLVGPKLGGNDPTDGNSNYDANYKVVLNKGTDSRNPNHFIFSTSEIMRQHAAASLIGTTNEKARITIHTLPNVEGKNWYNGVNTHIVEHDGNKYNAWAGGFNYANNGLTGNGWYKINNVNPFNITDVNDKQNIAGWLPVGNSGVNDIREGDGNVFHGIGYTGKLELTNNEIIVTDVAGNTTRYTFDVRWNSNSLKIESLEVDNTQPLSTTFDKDHPDVTLSAFSNNTNGFTVRGTYSGSDKSKGALPEKVYLVDVSKIPPEKLANSTGFHNTINQEISAGRFIPGLITKPASGSENGSWTVTYLSNFATGDLHHIKVVPVLVNNAGRIQDLGTLGIIDITELKKDYNITIDLKEPVSGSDAGPTFSGTIDNYDSDNGITGTININGVNQQITINATDPNHVTWSYTPTGTIGNAKYTVKIFDKYGNYADKDISVNIGNASAGLDRADDTGVSDTDGITSKNEHLHLVGQIQVEEGKTPTVNSISYTSDKITTPVTITNVTTTPDGKWTAEIVGKLDDGHYKFNVNSEDSVKASGKFTIDTTVPTSISTRIEPKNLNEHHLPGSNIFNSTPRLSGQVNNNVDGGDSPNAGLPVTITVFVPTDRGDGTTTSYVYKGLTNAGGAWEIPLNTDTLQNKDLPPLPDNPEYKYTASFTDLAGNEVKVPATGTFGLDRTPPASPQFGVVEGKLHSTSDMNLITTQFNSGSLHGKVDTGDRVEVSIIGAGLHGIAGDITNTDQPSPDKPLTFKSWEVDGKAAAITLAEDGKWNLNLNTLQDLMVKTSDSAPTVTNPDGAYYYVKVTVMDTAGNSSDSTFYYQMGKANPTSSIEVLQEDGSALYSVPGDTDRHNNPPTTFEPAPQFSGITRPGATVVLHLSGTKTQTGTSSSEGTGISTISATANDDGKWHIALKDTEAGRDISLKQGYYLYSITVTDENGKTNNIGATTMGGTGNDDDYRIRVDFTPVGTEDTIKFDPKDDTGDKGDHISNNPIQHIIGEATSFTSSINIYVSKDKPVDVANPGTPLAPSLIIDNITNAPINFSSPGDKSWKVNFTDPVTGNSSLADGTYYIYVVSKNIYGRTATEHQQITIDRNPPTLDVAALATNSDTGLIGDHLTSATSPTLVGTTKAGTKVTVHLLNKDNHEVLPAQTVKADETGHWNTTYHNLADDKYTYWLEATDPAGNKATRGSSGTPMEADHFTIQSTFNGPSALTFTSQLDSDSDSGNPDNITAITTPTITGTATFVRNSGTTEKPTSQVFLDIVVDGVTRTYSGYNSATVEGQTGNYKINITDPLKDGYYTYKVYTQDAAGNKSTIYNSPGNLSVTDTSGNVTRYAFKVQTGTPYQDTGITGASSHNITSSTGITFSGKILLGSGDKPTDYTVSLTATDFNQGSPTRPKGATATIDASGTWKTNTLNFTSYGTHSYTVTITDKKTGATTSYTSPFTIQNLSHATIEKNDTQIEQHGSQPVFAGSVKVTDNITSVKLYLYDSNNNPVNPKSGQVIPVVNHKFSATYSGLPLADGHYTYKLSTVSADGKESETSTSGVLEVWTTPPKLNFTGQDISLHQADNVSFGDAEKQILFSGTLDLKNSKFADSTKLKPEETVSVKFNDFTLHPATIDNTGKWHITFKQYQTALEEAKADPTHSSASAENNSTYTVTIQDRFKNTSSDTGDLTPNTVQKGEIYKPLFMGESEALASITVIIIGDQGKTPLTATTTANEKGEWTLTWSTPLNTDTYHYSVNVAPRDGSASYNTGQIGTFTINDYIPTATSTSDTPAVTDTAAAAAAPVTDDHSSTPAVRTARSLFDHLDDLVVLPRSMASSTHLLITTSDAHSTHTGSPNAASDNDTANTSTPFANTGSADSAPANSGTLFANNSDSAHTASTSSPLAINGSDTISINNPVSVANTPLTNTGSEHSDHPAGTTAPAANNVAATPPVIAGTDSGALPVDNNGLLSTSNAASSTNSALYALLANGTLLSPTGSAPASDLNTLSAPKAASNDTAVSLAALEHTTTDHEHHQAA